MVKTENYVLLTIADSLDDFTGGRLCHHILI